MKRTQGEGNKTLPHLYKGPDPGSAAHSSTQRSRPVQSSVARVKPVLIHGQK